MDEILLKTIHLEGEINNALSSCSDSLFNQDINNEETIKKLSGKFAKKGVCYVVCVGNIISGFVAFYVNDYKTYKGYLSIIVVKKDYQGLGFGALLLDVVLSTCKKKGMRELLLEVDSNNDSAILFYNKRGFIINESKTPNTLVLSKQIH